MFVGPGEYFVLEGDLGVLKDGVNFVGVGAEVVEDLALHPHWTDDVLLEPLLHLPLEGAHLGVVGEFVGEGVLLEEVGEFGLLVHQHHSACIPFGFGVGGPYFLEEGGLLGLGRAVPHSY